MAALSGIVAASYVGKVSTSSGGGHTLLYAVGAAVIGGTSLFGGKGKASDAVIGGLVIATIANGLGLLAQAGTSPSSSPAACSCSQPASMRSLAGGARRQAWDNPWLQPDRSGVGHQSGGRPPPQSRDQALGHVHRAGRISRAELIGSDGSQPQHDRGFGGRAGVPGAGPIRPSPSGTRIGAGRPSVDVKAPAYRCVRPGGRPSGRRSDGCPDRPRGSRAVWCATGSGAARPRSVRHRPRPSLT